MNPTQGPNPTPEVHNPLSAMRAGETVICEIKRHPIGLISMYFSFGLLLVIVAAAALFAPHVFTNYDRSMVYEIGFLLFLVAVLFSAIFMVIGTKVYNGNRWILTSDSLTQVTQRSLFDKQSSQLSLGNLEDVTAQQDGILAHMLNFGALRVETAGERSKFVLLYCPDPNSYAQKILVARESFEQDRGERPLPTDSGVNVNSQ